MSINQYYAEKKDIMDIFNLLVEYKKIDLEDCNYPDIDQDKSLNFLHTILAKGKIILLKDLDKNELIGCCLYNKSEYFFSKTQIMVIQMLYIKQNYRNYNLVKQLIESIKKQAENMPLVISITSGLGVDPVFKMLGFENMGCNWRLL